MIYDVAIIGGGPGGYTAALYCVRSGLSAVVLEKLSPGGQMAATNIVDNYPGFEEGIDGFTLGQKMKAGAERFGAQTVLAEVKSADLKSKIKKIDSSEGVFEAKTVIIATGAEAKKLGLPEEMQVADARYLSNVCKEVYLIHRRGELRASAVYMNALKAAGNVHLVWNSVVSKLLYDKTLTGITVQNVESGETSDIECSGLFVAVGRLPNTALFKDAVELDDSGYIVADESTRTNIPGVFAVGDVRTKALRQIVTACADGAVASRYIEDYIRE